MNRYILDTNICLAYVRGKSELYERIDNQLGLRSPNTLVIISVVTKAELFISWHSEQLGRKKTEDIGEAA